MTIPEKLLEIMKQNGVAAILPFNPGEANRLEPASQGQGMVKVP